MAADRYPLGPTKTRTVNPFSDSQEESVGKHLCKENHGTQDLVLCTIASYNATSGLLRFKVKNKLFHFEKTL
jgi:hypothetical protein